MKINLVDFIMHEEGFRNHMYRDSAGLPTIGVGHMLTKDELSSGKIRINDNRIKWHDGLTDEQVHELFRHDLHIFEEAVHAFIDVTLNHNQYVALTSLCYNIGSTAFLGSTLLKKINGVVNGDVADEWRRWKWSGGRIDPILIARRKREIIAWNTPI